MEELVGGFMNKTRKYMEKYNINTKTYKITLISEISVTRQETKIQKTDFQK